MAGKNIMYIDIECYRSTVFSYIKYDKLSGGMEGGKCSVVCMQTRPISDICGQMSYNERKTGPMKRKDVMHRKERCSV
jgi:hypothetical protein